MRGHTHVGAFAYLNVCEPMCLPLKSPCGDVGQDHFDARGGGQTPRRGSSGSVLLNVSVRGQVA
jgi:hypothetical protein